MALLDFIGAREKSAASPSQAQSAPDAGGGKQTLAPAQPHSADPIGPEAASTANPSDNTPRTPPTLGVAPVPKADESKVPPVAEHPALATRAAVASPRPDGNRRWSFFPGRFRLRRKPKASLPTAEKRDAAAPTGRAKAKAPPHLSSSDRRAKQSALLVRSLIVGSDTDEGDLASPQGRVSGVQMKAVKAQLLKPKTAGKLIAQLKALPALSDSPSRASEPIQAVCLPYTDEEADEKHLSRLRGAKQPPPAQSPPPPTTTTTTEVHTLPSASAGIESFVEAIRNLHIVSLFTEPDLGLGQPGDSPGLLAGAVPTAETVVSGITQITPQIMALAYATGKTIAPDHNGVYPPTDRISILTYWWGLELLLPPPTLAYLSRVQSISATVMSFLTTLGVMYEGVREILPFARYFSQYIDFEFNTIKAQDRGKGVICAATWIMPAALIPRPWDFPDPPKNLAPTQITSPTVKAPVTAPVSAQPSEPAPSASSPSPPGAAPAPPTSSSHAAPNLAPGPLISAPGST
ncbi:hypothetical protein BC826DRAFT_907825 [Russula brevipes]|nr:hypothetical protein BC826DRAFT_907825 [Russula brevipes]